MKMPFALLSFALLSLPAQAGAIDYLHADPGEDSSREMRFSCFLKDKDCTLLLADATDTRFSRAKKLKCSFEETPVAYTGLESYFKCSAEANGLRPGRKYLYKAVTGDGEESKVQSFTTAPSNGEFAFLWMGDVHSTRSSPKKITQVDAIFEEGRRMAGRKDISFVLFSGDAVKRGKVFSCWREWNNSKAMASTMFASIPGNKEYYTDKTKKRIHNRWFTAAHDNPPNGAPGLASSFWFIYGGVLFIGVDSLAPEGVELDPSVRREATKRQIAWFEKVVAANKGKYRYLVAFQHYPYFKKDGPCDWGGYEKWHGVFDKCKVDFALSGDSHSYVRSKPVRGGNAAEDGTVYMVCPEIDDEVSAPRIKAGDGLVAAFDDRSASYGACLFEVTKKSMTVKYILSDGKVYDTFSR